MLPEWPMPVRRAARPAVCLVKSCPMPRINTGWGTRPVRQLSLAFLHGRTRQTTLESSPLLERYKSTLLPLKSRNGTLYTQ